MSLQLTLQTNGVGATVALGRAIGGVLQADDVVALVGPLGVGKTYFTKGIALGLDIADDIVTSPTFVLQQHYAGKSALYHFDAYRLSGPAELESIGFAETCRRGGVVVVEWADRVADAIPADALWIELTALDALRRRLSLHTICQSLGQRLGAAGLDQFAAAADKT